MTKPTKVPEAVLEAVKEARFKHRKAASQCTCKRCLAFGTSDIEIALDAYDKLLLGDEAVVAAHGALLSSVQAAIDSVLGGGDG